MKSFLGALFLTLASFYFVLPAGADGVCPQFMPRPFSSIETRIDLGRGQSIEAKNIDCRKIGFGAEVVTGIQQMLGRELPTPSSIKFRMVDVFDNAFFRPEDFSLNVPYQLTIENNLKNPVYTIPVWAHEFGHAVLDATLRDAMPKWRSIIQSGVSPGGLNPAEVLHFLLSGYHEFFADVIAVLYAGRGDAVAKGLFFTGFVANPEGAPSKCPNSDPRCRVRNSKNDMSALSAARDFTDRSNQLGRWRGTRPDDDHNLLAPARFHIWKYYFSNPLIMHEKARLASATVDALMADLNRRLARVGAEPGGMTEENFSLEVGDVQRINAEFIQTLDETFARAFQLQ